MVAFACSDYYAFALGVIPLEANGAPDLEGVPLDQRSGTGRATI
jgi:hypothetical protein